VGKDQIPHVEMTREIARRFNFIYQREVFPVPDVLLTEAPVLPGTDGRKMSKSYGNCIYITEPRENVQEKILKMMTDPARVRRNDPGNPELSPVFALHKLYSSPAEIEEVAEGCRTARIGCIDCKKILIKNVLARLNPIREKRMELERKPAQVRETIRQGISSAQKVAAETVAEARRAIGIDPMRT